MELGPNPHQGLFGESFVRVLASAAGLIVGRAELDVTGEDFTIGYKGTLDGARHPKIDVQVKSWSRSRAVWKEGHWRYAMRAKHFNELAGTGFSLPRFLILVIVPDKQHDYATATTNSVTLRYAAYWMSLQDRQPVNLDPDSKVPVHIPGRNLLTVDALRALMRPPAAEPTRLEA